MKTIIPGMFLFSCVLLLSSCLKCEEYRGVTAKSINMRILSGSKTRVFSKVRVYNPYERNVDILNIPVTFANPWLWIELTDSLGTKDTLGLSLALSEDYECSQPSVRISEVRTTYTSFDNSHQVFTYVNYEYK